MSTYRCRVDGSRATSFAENKLVNGKHGWAYRGSAHRCAVPDAVVRHGGFQIKDVADVDRKHAVRNSRAAFFGLQTKLRVGCSELFHRFGNKLDASHSLHTRLARQERQVDSFATQRYKNAFRSSEERRAMLLLDK